VMMTGYHRQPEVTKAAIHNGWFHTGEVVRHPFTSVMELDDDGLITRWWDYSNLANLLDNAPQWWLEHIASGWRATLDD